MNTKTFIEKAIEGGWNPHREGARHVWSDKTKSWWYEWDAEDEDGEPYIASNPCCHEARGGAHGDFNSVVLDPLAWQAVGKVEGWSFIRTAKGKIIHEMSPWRMNMHRFIDALCDGKDLETALNEATQ